MPSQLAHIVLHLALCTASVGHGMHPAKVVHVEFDRHTGPAGFDQSFPIDATDPSDAVVEFDVPRGVYFMTVTDPKSSCGAGEFVDILTAGNRVISLPMKPRGARRPDEIPTLFSGITPLGFSYEEPTVVLLHSNVTCNGPVGDPVPIQSTTENDDTGFYVSLFSYETAVGEKPLLALRITDNSGGYRYIRMNIPLTNAYQDFPNTARFDVDDSLIDELIGKPEDTFLCLKLYKTSVSG